MTALVQNVISLVHRHTGEIWLEIVSSGARYLRSRNQYIQVRIGPIVKMTFWEPNA